jgi:uncharacterized OB-fold protein
VKSPPAVTVQRCVVCGRLDPGPRELCPVCQCPALESYEVPGEGVLLSWTVVRRPPNRFKAHGAYAVAVVDLDCGVRITGRLPPLPGSADETLDAPALGTRMRVAGTVEGAAIFEPEEQAVA